DSFYKNIGSSPSTPGNVDLFAARANMALRSSDQRLQINVRGEIFNSDFDHNALKNRNDYYDDVRSGSAPYVIAEDAISRLQMKGYRLNAEARYEATDGVELRFISSWQDGFIFDQIDGDRTSVSPPNVQLPDNPLYGVG